MTYMSKMKVLLSLLSRQSYYYYGHIEHWSCRNLRTWSSNKFILTHKPSPSILNSNPAFRSSSSLSCISTIGSDCIAGLNHRKYDTKCDNRLLQSVDILRMQSKKFQSSANISALRSDNDKRSMFPSNDKTLVLDRFIYVKTLDSLYEDVTMGIVLDTAYGDSHPNEDFDPSIPVVLALHDTPGTHHDVVPLLNFFAKLGCRVICPTFPGHGDTRGIMKNFDDIFSQVTMERATFVHDFLNALGVQRIDCVIGVGAASYTAMALCTRQADIYKSMALISPWPLTQPRYDISDKTLKHIHEFWEMVYFRPFVRLLLPAVKIGNAATSDEKITSFYLVQNLDFGEAEGFALTASLKDTPRFVAYGAKDDLVDEELYKALLNKLGISPEEVVSADQATMTSGNNNESRGLVFPESGYDILTNHHSILCTRILKLLQQFRPIKI